MDVLEKVLNHAKTGRSLESADEWIAENAVVWRGCLGVYEACAAGLRGYEVLLVEEIQSSLGHYLTKE